jgi:hypothetical protein
MSRNPCGRRARVHACITRAMFLPCSASKAEALAAVTQQLKEENKVCVCSWCASGVAKVCACVCVSWSSQASRAQVVMLTERIARMQAEMDAAGGSQSS